MKSRREKLGGYLPKRDTKVPPLEIPPLEAFKAGRIKVLVDDIDEDGAIARSEGDAPDVDGLVYITDGHALEIGEFAEVSGVDCDVHDLYATLALP